MKLGELLVLRGLPNGAAVKLVRHQDSRRFNVLDLERDRLLEVYQSFQAKPVFDQCKYLISFVGLENRQARLSGVYAVHERLAAGEHPYKNDFSRKDLLSTEGYYYRLVEQGGYEDLVRRLVIDWGRAALSWHQWFRPDNDKEVVELLPAGFVRPFPGYDEFVLRMDELRDIVASPDSNRLWHTMLGAVAGVYLIVDSKTGDQYVGSAYGAGGILGRWRAYAACGHGDNIRLRQVCAEAGRDNGFRFSILRTLPRSMTATEVIRFEQIYKEKLGTKAFGLNAN